MIKRTLLATAVAAAFADPALAGSCPKYVKTIDRALAGNHGLIAD